jgi:hypothetical protein
MPEKKNRSEKSYMLVPTDQRFYRKFGGTYPLIANQITSATITRTITPQTTGVTFFELPLRGESFGA